MIDPFTAALVAMVQRHRGPVIFPWQVTIPDAIGWAIIRTRQAGPCFLRAAQHGLRQ